jgi:hypothetical protein
MPATSYTMPACNDTAHHSTAWCSTTSMTVRRDTTACQDGVNAGNLEELAHLQSRPQHSTAQHDTLPPPPPGVTCGWTHASILL